MLRIHFTMGQRLRLEFMFSLTDASLKCEYVDDMLDIYDAKVCARHRTDPCCKIRVIAIYLARSS